MSSRKFNWKSWFNKKKCENSFNFFLKKGEIKKEGERLYLSKSHMKKVDYNLGFINSLFKQKKFYDWIIVGSYYAIYHASLALLTSQGYSSKNHSATLCALIYLFHDKLEKEDIELVSLSSLEKEEITYFVEAKEKRELVSYGIKGELNRNDAFELRLKAIEFVNRVREILI